MTQKFDNQDGRLRGRAGQARRLRIWTAHPHCAKCGRLTDYPKGFQADHIKPLHKGGEDTDRNLQTLCPPCHDTKTLKDMGMQERVTFDKEGRVQW